MNNNPPQYIGFWARVGAALIDTLVLAVVVIMLDRLLGLELNIDTVSGLPSFDTDYWNLLSANQIMYAVVVIAFWVWKLATPGKMVIGAIIVDEKTLGKPSTGQLIGRYLAYFVSIFPLCLGLFWVAFDQRKQGWHDKLANTLVIKNPA